MTDQGEPEHDRAMTPQPAPQPTGQTPPHSGESGTTARSGVLSRWYRSHPKTVLVTASALAFVLLGTGAVTAGAATADSVPTAATSASTVPGEVVTVTPTPTPTPTPTADPERPAPAAIPAATRLRTCSVSGAASDSRLGQFEGSVINATTGEVLFDRSGSTPARTGSVLKTLTSAVALSVLGADYRLSTTVTGDPGSGAISLVGGGDATLSATPPGANSVYTNAPKLSDLAAQVKSSLGDQPVSSITLDATYWNQADKWDPSWKRTEQTIGYHSEVTALQVDGDRATPAATTSPRSTDPIGRAGEAFRQALVAAGVAGASSAAIAQGTSSSQTVLAKVSSQPVSTLIGQMIPNSDNTLAEMLARVSSRVSGADGSAASLTALYRSVLQKTYGLDASNIVIVDGSGLSENNAVPSTFVARLMIQVANGDHGLGVVYQALPVSGKTGTLASRFTGSNAVARGAVHAKTGWIDTAYTLAGSIDAADGTKLTFAFYAIGNVRDSARAALDTLTASVYSCGDNLSTT